MSTSKRTEVETWMGLIEEIWRLQDALFDQVNATGRWRQKHGPHWVFSDVPYHLAYCHEDIVERGLALGADYPEAEQNLLPTEEAINEWNDRKFAERPAGHPVEKSLARMEESREAIRQVAARLNDDDLDRPFWMLLLLGWTTARTGLAFCLSHDWSEFMQLRIHMGQQEPAPSAAANRAYINFILPLLTFGLDKEAAGDREFTAVMAFTDPGVGAWTIRVADGEATLSEGAAQNADLVMTQSIETFEKTIRGIQDPAEAIQSGAIQVSDFEALATYGQLFPA